MVIGDPHILIQAMVTNTFPTQMNLRHILKKIIGLSHSFQKIDFFHVLHHLNTEANQDPKVATHLSRGQLSLNGTLVFVPLPQGHSTSAQLGLPGQVAFFTSRRHTRGSPPLSPLSVPSPV